jgi:Raf kinase inhibitor-like YbhB/YbcL family protein/uncharacterized protein (TIGR00297 family)
MTFDLITPYINAFNFLFSWFQLGIGFLLALAIALAAYYAGSLSRSGAAAAILLGTAIFGIGGYPWAMLLLGFFISSSLLSRLFREQKSKLDEKFSKGSQRDAGQVLANGGAAGLLVILQAAVPDSAWPWVAAAVSLAAANADTWSTELGVLSRKPPRLITTGKITEPGTSGAISLTGTLNGTAGALLIAILAVLVWPPYAGSEINVIAIPLRLGLITLGGLAGSLLDSLLGATLQAIYRCPTCAKETERHPLHICGTQTIQIRGLSWLNNDWVNTACTVSGALLGVAMAVSLAAPLALNRPAILAIPKPEGGNLMLTSSAFNFGEPIPAKYTCTGDDISPPLSWEITDGVQSYALIVDDPDAPMGIFTHWVVYNLPASLTGLPEAVSTEEFTQGKNSFQRKGYGGPCPPPGKTHRYNFTLYALDIPAELTAGLDKAGLLKAISGHILSQSNWMGTYKR